jgi:hypothetical protein
LVLKSTFEEGMMAHHNRKVDEEMKRGILLGDGGFLREIGERVLQELSEVESTENIVAAPTSAPRTARATATATSRGL